MICRIIFILSFVLTINGCLSQIVPVSEFAQNWIGRPIEDLNKLASQPESYQSRVGWKGKTYALANGNLVYVDLIRPDYYIHWEINPKGIIINYKTEGSRCY